MVRAHLAVRCAFRTGLAGVLMLNVSRVALASFTPQPNRDIASDEADLSSVSLSGYRHGRVWLQSSETRRQRKDSVERGREWADSPEVIRQSSLSD